MSLSQVCLALVRTTRTRVLPALQQQQLCPQRAAHSSSFTYRTHTCGELRRINVGEDVTLCGWSCKPRVFGKGRVAFVPLLDASGSTQLVCDTGKWGSVLDSLRTESVVRATGRVEPRPTKDVNAQQPSGEVEVHLSSLEVLNTADPELPFRPSEVKAASVGEELALRERPLELRRPALQTTLRLRSQVAMAMREFLIHKHNFVEVETPTLFKKTSEGAQEFLVPTRSPGKFYSLVQSPQQFKQLLMVGGLDRYFQFARCYRDEDLRADRQPEFTQVDMELSFVDGAGVMALVEELLSTVLAQCTPHLRLPAPPFPRITHSEAVEQYGTDKPDTRADKSDGEQLNFLWVCDFPLFTVDRESGKVGSEHHPFTAPLVEDEDIVSSCDSSRLERVRGQHYDLVVNGVELGGGSVRIHSAQLQELVLRDILKVPLDEFEHLLKGLRSGCPPHAGIALGFDRLMAVLCRAKSLREVLAFPKSFLGKDLLTGAPSSVTPQELATYHINTTSHSQSQ